MNIFDNWCIFVTENQSFNDERYTGWIISTHFTPDHILVKNIYKVWTTPQCTNICMTHILSTKKQ